MNATKHQDDLILSVVWPLPLDLVNRSDHRGLSRIQKTYCFADLLKGVLHGGNGMGLILKERQQVCRMVDFSFVMDNRLTSLLRQCYSLPQ